MRRFIWPLVIFFVLIGFFAVGLRLNPREVPSPLIGKPAPNFTLAQLHQENATIAPADMKNKVWLLNVWASWCVSCRQEHPVLMELARQDVVPIVGLDYKDDREPAKSWLNEHGNPYRLSAWDREGKVGIDYGVYGVPETFVIGRDARIAYKLVGPITPENLQSVLAPQIEKALASGS